MRRFLAATILVATLDTATHAQMAEFVRSTEQEGITDLAQHATHSEREAVLAYAPSQETWYRADGYVFGNTAYPSWQVIESLCRDEKIVRVYHDHLLSASMAQVTENALGNPSVLSDEWRIEREERAYPSIYDLNAAAYGEYRCHQAHPTARLEHAVVSVTGTPVIVDGKPTERKLQPRVVRWRVDEDSELARLAGNAMLPAAYDILVAPVAEREAAKADTIISDGIRTSKTRPEILREASDATQFTFWEDP